MTAPPMKSKLPRKSSKASELVLHDVCLQAPSTKILSYFQSPCSLWLALDIETHELIPNTALYQGWITGQFGHPCCVNENQLQDLRIVQIGWSIGYFDASSDPLTKSLLEPVLVLGLALLGLVAVPLLLPSSLAMMLLRL